ncbi:MAG: hypothetical protein EON93_11560 [Burkholderiales bacterium]|nr:MAG: hypothetical protein EON93_11560 [Burkholderiales bacterium]
MVTIKDSLRLAAGLVLASVIQTASAQAPGRVDFNPADMSRFDFSNVTDRRECPVEPHRKAISPDIILCHAKFAPLPEFPQEINPENPEHYEILRERADILLRQLDRPNACNKYARVSPMQACAILVYVLDEEFRQSELPWTYIVKIYRITHPPKQRDIVVSVVNHNNSELRFGPSSPDGEVWKLLADQRAKTRCELGASEFIRNSGASAASRTRNPDKCDETHMDVRYRPALVIGRDEAEKVLNRESIRSAFGPN